MRTVQWVLVKGTLLDAHRAAKRHGMRIARVWIPPSTNHRFPETCLYVEGTYTALTDWLCADREAPFPPGALLWHRDASKEGV